jgi:glutaryl-CoA dehydrogenase
MGAAEDCWHRARQYGLDRVQFGRPLAQTQLYQKKLADMQTEIALGLQGALRAGRMLDAGTLRARDYHDLEPDEAQQLRQGAGDRAGWRATCMAATGSWQEYHVMRHAQNLETVNTYEGTHDVHALILGRAQTGLQAFF